MEEIDPDIRPPKWRSATICTNPTPARVFISYSSHQRELAERIAITLRSEGHEVFFDRHKLVPGEAFHAKIRAEVRQADLMVFLISPQSVSIDSYARTELRVVEREWKSPAGRIIPVLAEATPMKDVPAFLREVQMVERGRNVVAEVAYAVDIINREASKIRPPDGPSDEQRSRTQNSITTRLEEAYKRREELIATGKDIISIDKRILDLRRKQRNGPMLNPGEFLGQDGRFRLIEIVGRGGFATVWKAYDRKMHQLVAIKVLHGQFAQDASKRTRLFRGARKMAELQHSNIVRVVVPKGNEQGFYYYVMEYVTGGDLHGAVVEGRIGADQALAVVEVIASALEVAHARGFVHRDIKPQNILLRKDGTPALTDFDLVQAKDTTGGTRTGAMGTVLYAAPEQNDDASSVDHQADIYSLGMTAVFCMYGSELPRAAMYQRDAFLANLPCKEALRAVMIRAVALPPAIRFESMSDFRIALIAARRNRWCEYTRMSDLLNQLKRSRWEEFRFIVIFALRLVLLTSIIGSTVILLDMCIDPSVGPSGPSNWKRPVVENERSPVNSAMVRGNISGSRVYLDGEYQCNVPCEIRVPVGDGLTHEIRIKKDGFVDAVQLWRPKSVREQLPPMPDMKKL